MKIKTADYYLGKVAEVQTAMDNLYPCEANLGEHCKLADMLQFYADKAASAPGKKGDA